MKFEDFQKAAQHRVIDGINNHIGMKPIVGFDLSLKSTGVAVLWERYLSTFRFQEVGAGAKRLAYYRNQILDVIERYQPGAIGIEDYAYGAVSKSLPFTIGELGGVARVACYDSQVPTILIPPPVMKKFVTSRGDAYKPVVRKAINERFGVYIKQSDEADAAGIALFTADYYYNIVSYPNPRDGIMDKARELDPVQPVAKKV